MNRTVPIGWLPDGPQRTIICYKSFEVSIDIDVVFVVREETSVAYIVVPLDLLNCSAFFVYGFG